MKNATPGSMVQFVLPDGTVRPAHVDAVDGVKLTLRVHVDTVLDEHRVDPTERGNALLPRTSSKHDPGKREPGTWHWHTVTELR